MAYVTIQNEKGTVACVPYQYKHRYICLHAGPATPIQQLLSIICTSQEVSTQSNCACLPPFVHSCLPRHCNTSQTLRISLRPHPVTACCTITTSSTHIPVVHNASVPLVCKSHLRNVVLWCHAGGETFWCMPTSLMCVLHWVLLVTPNPALPKEHLHDLGESHSARYFPSYLSLGRATLGELACQAVN